MPLSGQCDEECDGMIYLLIGYMWLYIHRPFEVWPWLGAMRIERVFMIMTIAYWLVAVRKALVPNRLNAAFLAFGGVMLLSSALGPYGGFLNGLVEDWLKVAVFFVLVITSVRDERDLRLLVAGFLGAMGLYVLHCCREYVCGRGEYMMGTWRMAGINTSNSHPNAFAATVLYSLPMVYPLWCECRARWQRCALIGYVVLAVACILLTGSRTGFTGLVFLVGIAVLASRHRLKIALVLALAAPIVWGILPEDRQNRYLTLVDSSYGPANAQASAEGRLRGWYSGVQMWRNYPLTGIGPGEFLHESTTGEQAHVLYGQLLGEMGTLGAMAFACVLLAFLANALATRRTVRETPELQRTFPTRLARAVSVTVLLLLVMGLGGHNLYRYTWLWYGAFQSIAIYCLQQRADALNDELELNASESSAPARLASPGFS